MVESIFTFIITHIDVEGEMPIDLGKDHFFRKATDKEIDAIEGYFKKISLMPRHNEESAFGIPYRAVVREERYEGRTSYQKEELPREKWKYWIIAHNGTNHLIEEFQLAAILIPIDLDFGSTFMCSQRDQQGDIFGYIGTPIHLIDKYFQFYEGITNAKNVSASQIVEIGKLRDQINNLPQEAGFVKQALANFKNIRPIPSGSTLRVIGYMAIIESLITHAPRLSETLDSITHQMVNKMILLNKRFSRQIDQKTYFRQASEDKIWKLLYSYRSCLAHGGVPDFKGVFQLLESHEKVVSYLKEIIKELILYGLKEHIFLSDLKKC